MTFGPIIMNDETRIDTRPGWDTTFMSMAYLIAMRSPDRSTQVGAVITSEDNVPIAMGYNGLPRGMDDNDDLHVRPQKYFYFEHAERNAIYNAARAGVRMDLAHRLYVTWVPCADCARAIIQTGIKDVVVHYQGQKAFDHSVGNKGNWNDSQYATRQMFQQCRVQVTWYIGEIVAGLTGKFAGKTYAFPEPNMFEEVKEND